MVQYLKGNKIYQVKNVIALFIYNKPDTTKKVLASIKKVNPKTLIIISDGPKDDQMDIKNVHQTLNLIQELELECNIITNFSDVNLGLKNRFSSGMKFIFEETDQAIILEDDCLPTTNFFRFLNTNSSFFLI